jgi:hypothetical protein
MMLIAKKYYANYQYNRKKNNTNFLGNSQKKQFKLLKNSK